MSCPCELVFCQGWRIRSSPRCRTDTKPAIRIGESGQVADLPCRPRARTGRSGAARRSRHDCQAGRRGYHPDHLRKGRIYALRGPRPRAAHALTPIAQVIEQMTLAALVYPATWSTNRSTPKAPPSRGLRRCATARAIRPRRRGGRPGQDRAVAVARPLRSRYPNDSHPSIQCEFTPSRVRSGGRRNSTIGQWTTSCSPAGARHADRQPAGAARVKQIRTEPGTSPAWTAASGWIAALPA